MKISASVVALGAVAVMAGASSGGASAASAVEQETIQLAAGKCPYSGSHPQVSYSGGSENTYSAAVKHAQCLWNVQNSGGKKRIDQDGYFGPATRAAMWQIQAACGINSDGIVGPDTWKCLHPDQTPNPSSAHSLWPI